MNGPINFAFDTNAVIAAMQGNGELKHLVSTADAVIVSIISSLEFRAAANLSAEESRRFDSFVAAVRVVDVGSDETSLNDEIVRIRPAYRLKLPDSIVASTAITRNATLVTRDHHFRRVDGLKIKDF